jgi:predicted metal-dependent hydrolase
MEKQKIKIQIEKGKRTVWGSCKVNNNLIAAVGLVKN